jgi:hypothetical protein
MDAKFKIRPGWGKVCPGCGEVVVSPDRSEFVSERLVLNLWSCTECGNWFESAWMPKGTAPKKSEIDWEAVFPALLVA